MKSTTNFDQIYNEMFNQIYDYGQWSSDKVRTRYADNTPALRKQILGYSFRFDNSTDTPPIITSRYAPIKSAVSELYWIWFMRSNKVQDLRDLGCKFWDEFEMSDGTIGHAYGAVLADPVFHYNNQVEYILDLIQNQPDSTRIITDLWDAPNLHRMSLTPCVYRTSWSVFGDTLNLKVNQRSCDFALGLVSNVYQYSVLHKVVANHCELKSGDLIWDIDNLQYYDRHEANLIKQFEKYNKEFNVDKPRLEIIKSSFDEFKPSNVILHDYTYLQKLSYEIAI
jgi:thymidylate synthase